MNFRIHVVSGEDDMKARHLAHSPDRGQSGFEQSKSRISLPFVVVLTRIVIKYRVSREECSRLRENVPYVKVHRYNPKHLYTKLNGYGDNGERKVWSSCCSTYCACSADALPVHCACPSLRVECSQRSRLIPKCAVSNVKDV